MATTLERFLKITQELADLSSVMSNLNWDQETMMPSKGSQFRARQTATLASIYHRKLIEPDYGSILEDLQGQNLSLWESASLKEARRERDKAVKIPAELVHELAETASLSYTAWVKAREESNFPEFAPWLEKMIRLKRLEASCLAEDGQLYNALIDDYEPRMTTGQLDPLFEGLRPCLTRLLERIIAAPRQPDKQVLLGNFPESRQEAFGREVLTAMGYDWEAGRMDRSPHPFCTGLSPLDVRITTRYSEQDFSVAFFGMVHEAGHGLYEQGLDQDHFGMPACDAISLGIHESQSRLWEIFIARSHTFWQHWYGPLQGSFPGQFDDTPLDVFLHAINEVKPGFIRVEADEVTYGLHVILRYELEKLLISGDLEVEDVEEVWDEKMRDYLGITPATASDGVLQDVHWSHGLIGYFPTYLLGTLYAAQLFNTVASQVPNFEEEISSGQMLNLREWLRQRVHQPGRTRTADELVREVTGESLSTRHFLDHLETKYGQLYEL